jgi:hypothetical protein
MPLTLTISKLRFPSNGEINNPITVTLEIKEYYADAWVLIDSGINVDVDGTILDSPLPTTTVDPELKYIIRATNELCGFEYTQTLSINPYCPVGYELAPDGSYCFYIEETEATPPTSPENTIAATDAFYGDCGTYIYEPGYSSDGTGTSNQIPLSNNFWKNGTGNCTPDGNTNDGRLNEAGLWATTCSSNQDVGFAICINIAEEKTYFIGFGVDNYGILKIDGAIVIQQDPAELDLEYGIVGAAFHVWHIYPVTISSGEHIIEVLGHNDTCPAAFGCEIYDNTEAEIIAATSYGDLNLLFSTKDYVGTAVQLGTGGIGYSCPVDYALAFCESPVVCRKLITTPILY